MPPGGTSKSLLRRDDSKRKFYFDARAEGAAGTSAITTRFGIS
ncbi:MAG TPA: hypothetical protein VF154_01660 [Terriglobales bacterium]